MICQAHQPHDRFYAFFAEHSGGSAGPVDPAVEVTNNLNDASVRTVDRMAATGHDMIRGNDDCD